jgi:hypothetical protein
MDYICRWGSMPCGFTKGLPDEWVWLHDSDSQQISASDSTMGILDKRYALGEINKEEYEEEKKVP